MKVIQTDFQRKYGWIISAVLSIIWNNTEVRDVIVDAIT